MANYTNNIELFQNYGLNNLKVEECLIVSKVFNVGNGIVFGAGLYGDIDPDNILITTGTSEALFIIRFAMNLELGSDLKQELLHFHSSKTNPLMDINLQKSL